MSRHLFGLGGLLSLIVVPLCVAADGPLAVDQIILKSGRTLRGAILSRNAAGTLIIAVSREWLSQADPREFNQLSERDAELQRDARRQTQSRIELELVNPPDAPRLVYFLKEELKRLQKPDGEETAPFLLLDIPASQVAKTIPATIDRQKLALWAWREGFVEVENQSADSLRKKLVNADIAVDGPPPDLSHRLPTRPQSDREWTARRAIVSYTLEAPLDFQGMGDTLVRTGEGQKFNLAVILPKLWSSQVDSLLDDLLEPGLRPMPKVARDSNGLRTAIATADRLRRRGFRVTRLDLNTERMTVGVQTEFIAKFVDSDWQTVWSHTETADGSQSRPEAEARIAEDPQVKPLLKSLEVLGLGAEDTFLQAVRVGAATMAAQQAADARFFEFRDRYVKRLDGPPLSSPAK